MQRHVLFYSIKSNLVNCLNWLCGKSLSGLKLRYIIIGSFVIGELFFSSSSLQFPRILSFLQKKTIIHNLLFIILTLVHLLHYSQTSWCTFHPNESWTFISLDHAPPFSAQNVFLPISQHGKFQPIIWKCNQILLNYCGEPQTSEFLYQCCLFILTEIIITLYHISFNMSIFPTRLKV